VLTVLPHVVLRYRQLPPDVARDALLATYGGLSLERCAVTNLVTILFTSVRNEVDCVGWL
jgi:hypothetical protein